MRQWVRETSGAWGAPAIAALGVVYVALAVARAFVVTARGARPPGQFLNVVLVALPSLALVYGAVRLRRTDVHPETYPRIAGWSLLGGGVIVGVILLVELTPGGGVENIGLAVLLFGSLGSVAGLGIGVNEARAVTRARDLERQRREVERYSRRLQQQNERLESFGGMLAHELRNPLNVAQIYVQQVDGDEAAVAQIEQALDRIEEMIDVLLLTARGQDADIDREAVSLGELAEAAWTGLDPAAADLAVESDCTVFADPVHVRHLLENLFRNAVQHGPEDVTVRVGCLSNGKEFYVEDDGPGIPAEQREAVLGAGFTTDSGGTGLGLTFVAQLAQAYDWELRVTESDDGGARFEFAGVDRATVEEAQKS